MNLPTMHVCTNLMFQFLLFFLVQHIFILFKFVTGSANQSLSNTTSINSIATDVTCTHLPDSLDAKIEALLREWHHSGDLLFSIHPIDGSFLIW